MTELCWTVLNGDSNLGDGEDLVKVYDTAICHVIARDVAPLAVSVSSITVVSPGQQSTLPALQKPLLPVDDAALPTK